MTEVRRTAGVTASEQIARDLRAQIFTGVFAPGTKIPSTSELKSTYGVSLMTVRAGVETLRREGLVYGRQGAGVFVAERPERSVPAFVEDVEVPGAVRQVFIRLVPRGTVTPSDTLSSEALVDLDGDGKVIGVTVTLPPRR